MITTYVRRADRVLSVPLEPGAALPEGTVWIDLLRPSDAERQAVEAALGVELPTYEDMAEIEVSSRLYTENSAIYMTTPVIHGADTPTPALGLVSFVLAPQHLVTIRFGEPKPIPTFAQRAVRRPELLATAEDALLGLLDAVIDRAADVLEVIGGQLDVLSRQLFRDDGGGTSGRRPSRRQQRGKTAQLQEILRGVGRVGDMTHKLRDSLAGLERLVMFLTPLSAQRLQKEQKVLLKVLSRDLRSLSEHAGFLAHQTNFLLDATLGVINAEQSNIIKMFSIVAVVFLPPTLIASIYGMNFAFMPELEWVFGYPLALILMVVSAIVPLLYFRRRGWM